MLNRSISAIRSVVASALRLANPAGDSTQSVQRSGALARMPRAGIAYDGVENARQWEAAYTTEENASQWYNASADDINQMLVLHYETITQRASLEARRNPTVEGVIKSHACDVVGDEGPGLVMQTADPAWNTEAEQIFYEISEAIDGSGSLSLGEWLRQDMYQMWTSGDMLCQIVEDPAAATAIKTRIHPIHPNRLRSPYSGGNVERLILGIERTPLNRPIQYWLTNEIQSEYGYNGMTYAAIPARDILHWFNSLEPGQVRGLPLLASCLQVISDLREYDNAVLDAAKVQAMMAVLMWSTNQNVEPDEVNAEVRLKKMGITKLPIGWQAQAMNTSQPSAQNSEFRKERSRDLGRPAGMPLMQVRLDSSGHNYSSARFDAQIYQKSNRIIQGSLGRHRIYPLVQLILNEAMRNRLLAPRLFNRNQVVFRWPQPPHVDPVKEAMAERIRLENRTLSPQAACAAHNIDFEQLVKDWASANRILEANGMPPLLGGLPTNLADLAMYLNGGVDPASEGQGNGQDNSAATNETSAA